MEDRDSHLAKDSEWENFPSGPSNFKSDLSLRLIGVSRDEAKVLNYGRIYGAGVPFAKQLLQTFNPTLSEMVC